MSKSVISCTWWQVGHLNEQDISDLLNSYPPHVREARSKGVPSLGSGQIYPLNEADFTVKDFAIPEYWPRAYALDVGFNTTAAIWGARNNDNGVTYLYSEHYAGNAIPAVHAEAIKSRGATIKGVIDPAARGRGQADGQRLLDLYVQAGLDIQPANNAVEAGIYKVWQMLVGGQLKIFESLSSLRSEMRLYRRDEKGKVHKVKDHACDAMRYLVFGGGMDRADVPSASNNLYTSQLYRNPGGSWLS